MRQCFVLLLAFCTSIGILAADDIIQFKKTQLDAKFRSEGVAVGDFNKDGKMDIAAGSVWYEAPDWKMHAIDEKPAEYDPKSYSNSFCNFAEDLNGDGWTDFIRVDFPSKEKDGRALEEARVHQHDQQREPHAVGFGRRRQARARLQHAGRGNRQPLHFRSTCERSNSSLEDHKDIGRTARQPDA